MPKKESKPLPRQSLLTIAKGVVNKRVKTFLDDLDEHSRAEMIQIAEGMVNGSIVGSQRQIARALADATGLPITRNHLTTLIERVKSGVVK